MEVLVSDLTNEGPAATNAAPTSSPAPIAAAEAEALWIVSEYLRDAGLRNPHDVATESRRIVTQAKAALTPRLRQDPQSLAEAAIDVAVRHLEHWLTVLADDVEVNDLRKGPHGVVGARLPQLLARYPQAFRGKPTTYEQIEQFGDHVTPVVPQPRPRRMHRQQLRLLPAPLRRWLYRESGADSAPPAKPCAPFSSTGSRAFLAATTIASTVPAAVHFWRIAGGGALPVANVLLTTLFAVLFAWTAFSFWSATLGLIVLWRRARRPMPPAPRSREPLPVTAVVMPVYNEDTASVFANIRACVEEADSVGAGKAFHFFVLSDTTDPDIWLAEERAWAALAGSLPPSARVFYRHRAENRSRKAGNIAEFCTRWGGGYRYMIVLDADSVMAGATMVEMVRRMERDPQLGILQVPPTPVDRHSLFARMQQFASRVYGPVFLEGFAQWSQCDGNYWGHNAILRVEPFMKHCELPVLPGDGPLGGEILSHDFVEAALMRRAGYKVCLAHDLDGSYEQCPPTLSAFAQRDQRWCQGNLQHLRLLLAEGFHPLSRLHLGMGVLSYVASPLWLLFLVLTFVAASLRAPESHAFAYGGALLFGVSMLMLLLPKLWGAIAWQCLRRSAGCDAAHDSLIAGVLLETLLSILIAPNMMLFHSWFVFSTFIGHKVKWNVQQRDERGVSLGEAWQAHRGPLFIGVGAGVLIAWAAPQLLPWFLPILVGLWLAIPLAVVLGSVRLGRSLESAGVLAIPEERNPPAVLRRRAAALDEVHGDERDLFAAAVPDPAYYALHAGILRATQSEVPMSADAVREAQRRAAAHGLASFDKQLRRNVLRDHDALAAIHKTARLHPRQPSPLAT
jgi:membrane glycosyltransferase